MDLIYSLKIAFIIGFCSGSYIYRGTQDHCEIKFYSWHTRHKRKKRNVELVDQIVGKIHKRTRNSAAKNQILIANLLYHCIYKVSN